MEKHQESDDTTDMILMLTEQILSHSNPKAKITERGPVAGNTKDCKIVVPLKYSSSFWRTVEILLMNCEIILQINWSANYVITDPVSSIPIPVAPLSTPKIQNYKTIEIRIPKNNQLEQISIESIKTDKRTNIWII